MSNNKLAAVAGVNENKWYKNCVSNGQKPLRARTHNIQANQNIHKLHSRLFRVSVFLTTYRHQFRNSNTFYNCIVVFGVCLFARFFLFLSFGPFLLLLLLLWIFWVQAFLWPLFVALGVMAFANLFVYPHTHTNTLTHGEDTDKRTLLQKCRPSFIRTEEWELQLKVHTKKKTQ